MTTAPNVTDTPPRRRRILFVGEAVTLAHVARPFALARSLDAARYDVQFACDPRFMSDVRDLFESRYLAFERLRQLA